MLGGYSCPTATPIAAVCCLTIYKRLSHTLSIWLRCSLVSWAGLYYHFYFCRRNCRSGFPTLDAMFCGLCSFPFRWTCWHPLRACPWQWGQARRGPGERREVRGCQRSSSFWHNRLWYCVAMCLPSDSNLETSWRRSTPPVGHLRTKRLQTPNSFSLSHKPRGLFLLACFLSH